MNDLHFTQISFDLPVLHRFLQETFSDWVKPEDMIGILIGHWLGEGAPRSIRIEENQAANSIAVYFWSAREHLEQPTDFARLQPKIVSRHIPATLLDGKMFRFNLRCSPMIRRRGHEIDAWINPDKEDQVSAYRHWTMSRLKGADLQNFDVVSTFGKTFLLPGAAAFRRLTADFTGTFIVRDADAAAQTLINGIGRNGRLGYGTLIIGQAPEQETRNPMPH